MVIGGTLTTVVAEDNMSDKSTEKTGSRKFEKENIDTNVEIIPLQKVMKKQKSQ